MIDALDTLDKEVTANEQQRINNENTRVSSENARKESENLRREAENTRASNEEARETAETGRASAEDNRVKAEQSRVETENNRVTAENTRVEKENERQTAENTRDTNEQSRKEAETNRVKAEEGRVTEFNRLKSESETATLNATAQADYAKQQGDNVAGTVNEIKTAQDELTTSINNLTTVLNTQQGNKALYVAAGAVYNKNTGFYELNGLTDITEEEMRTIYLQTHVMDKLSSYYNIFASSTFRTNLGFNIGITQTNGRNVDFRESFFFNQKLEVLRLSFGNINETRMIRTSDMFYAFHGCKKLKRIISPIYVYDIKNKLYFDHTFSQCILLETALLYKLSVSISFSDSPLLSLESLQYLITNAANTSPITVTVHANVYAKIQDETNAEWHALIETAAAKQITFATA